MEWRWKAAAVEGMTDPQVGMRWADGSLTPRVPFVPLGGGQTRRLIPVCRKESPHGS